MSTEPEAADDVIDIPPVDRPINFDQPQFTLPLEDVNRLIGAPDARALFQVDGSGLTAAVLDTGINAGHVDFAGRVVAQCNFTADNGGDPADASDGNAHGTNVGGIIVANGDHIGIAPGAGIAALKVLGNDGGGSFASVEKALQWVLDHREQHHISVVCMSLGDGSNRQSDAAFANNKVRSLIRQLREAKVAVCVASGNDFFRHQSKQGMSYPAILRETVSVGAVYDEFEGPFSYGSGAATTESGPDRITPFSQRLHESVNADCAIDIFAPGAPVRSAGIPGPHGESIQHGTSQATPVTAGVILLVQELFRRETGALPEVDLVVEWLRLGGVRILDGDDEKDNVKNTNLAFIRLSAMGALEAVKRHLTRALLSGNPLRA